jgi:pimeloyl-ACP methyl ester carboxylesterase
MKSASKVTAPISLAITSSTCASWSTRNSPKAGWGRYLLDQFVEREPKLRGEAIAQVFMAGNHTDTTARLSTMKVPTLVINGEFDHSLPAGQKTASLVPGAVHRVLPGTGHACCIEDPAGFDRLVLDFLDSRALMPEIRDSRAAN